MDMKVTTSANNKSPMPDKHNYSEVQQKLTGNNIYTRSWTDYIQVKCRQRRLHYINDNKAKGSCFHQ